MQVGRAEESLEQQDLALREDPLNPLYRVARIISLVNMGQDVASEAHEFLKINENHVMPYYALASSYARQGMWAEAIPFAEKAHSLSSAWGANVGLLAGLLARTGDKKRAEAILQELRDGKVHSPLGFATFHLLCGDVDAAADSIEIAIKERMPSVGLLVRGPFGKDLRSSPRWRGLERMMNLPENRPAKAESSK